MSPSQNYLGALKYFFGEYVFYERKSPREAWKMARYRAATFAFNFNYAKPRMVSVPVSIL